MPTAAETLAAMMGTSTLELDARAAGALTSQTHNRVQDSREFRRILNLPRRDWEANAKALADQITSAFKTPYGRKALYPIQGAALYELHAYGGVIAPINVGGGKTLISYLAPEIIGAKRPLLLVPSSLVTKTEREFKDLARDFKGPAYIRILGYEMLGRAQSAEILTAYQPDLIIMDEAHRLKNKRAAVTRRVIRYMKERPNTRCIAMSGTFTNKSLLEFAHIVEWCLPRQSFLPCEHKGPGELEMWAAALDENRTEAWRPSPGVLFDLCNEEERALIPVDPLQAARRGFGRRMTETPGVVATKGGKLGTSLQITSVTPKERPEMDDMFSRMMTLWETPGGEPIADALELYRHSRELACGLYYRWNPEPPEEWLEPRRAWAKLCREIVTTNRRGLDSELPVINAVDAGLYPYAVPILEEWRKVKGIYNPKDHMECVWVSDAALNLAAEWAEKNAGIIWVEHRHFGFELAKRTGLPYYRAQGLDARGNFIEDHPKGKPLIASVASNKDGRNLQFKWYRNLVVSCPPLNMYWEQLMGRTHRPLQPEDTVFVEVMLNCYAQVAGFERARLQAKRKQDTELTDQKLCYADIDVPDTMEAYSMGPRFRK